MGSRDKRRRARSAAKRSGHEASQRERAGAAAAARDKTDADNDASIRVALDRLTPEERLVCLGKQLQFSSREIARHLARSVDAIEAIYSRAKAKVQRCMK